jgi:transposase
MAAWVTDDLWAEVAPLLPERRATCRGGRPWSDDRAAFAGVVFVLRTGIPWQALPAELGCGSGSTCWRRFAEWTEAGVWPKLLERLIAKAGRLGLIDLCRAVIDSQSVRAVKGGRTPAPTRPTAAKRAASGTS